MMRMIGDVALLFLFMLEIIKKLIMIIPFKFKYVWQFMVNGINRKIQIEIQILILIKIHINIHIMIISPMKSQLTIDNQY